MTIAALRALLDQEQPHVRRPPAPPLRHRRPKPSQDPTMDAPTARPTAGQPLRRPEIDLPDEHLAELLLWASLHNDPAVTATGEQIRTAVNTLTIRRKRDAELAQITDEAAELEKRLAELRARQAELQPAAKSKPKRDYDPMEVRNWARVNGHTVPDRGQIPKVVMAAWRNRGAPAEGAR